MMTAEFNKINIGFVIDDNYAEHCAVTIASILLNSESVFHFYILYNELSLKNKNRLDNLKKIKYFEITFVRVDLKAFEECYLDPNAHFSIATYFKLRISSLLPNINKIVYLDSDTVVIRDVKELWNISFDDAYIIACKTIAHKSNCKRLGLSTGAPCINAGVMVLDLKRIRDDSLEYLFFKCIQQNHNKLKYADQDVINLVLSVKEGAIKQIQQNWNTEDAPCISYDEDYLPIIHNPYIIHFMTGEKPWHAGSRQLFKEKYWQYHHEVAMVNPSKLIMTLLVRNEEDIVRYNIDFHLSKGVDFIIATDNGSTDTTRDILREYEEKGLLHLIDERTHNHNQAEWNNHMARVACDQYAADIIFHCDADEFWYPRSGNLKNEISKRQEKILLVDVVNVLLEDKGGTETFPEATRFAVVNPIITRNYQEEFSRTNLLYIKYPPKVIFKSKDKLLFVSQGNHMVTNKDESITEGQSQDVVIYHYPIRSKAHFSQKTIMGGCAYENNYIHSKDIGFHKRRWYASYKNGLLDEEYKKLLLHEGEVNKLLLDGFIEEIDFNNVMLGHEDIDDRWRFYNRRFEHEDMFQDLYWAWAGHKYFAYDLVRNVRPKIIVELGTHKGMSFYSFCQAVKDAHYDASLYAIDTWQGDEHSGFYDDNVFKEVKEIKDKYYGSFKIKLLQKRFDEAVDEFEDHSIDLLHIDGLHTYQAVKHDFETWFPKVKKHGIILLHDIFVNRDDFGVYKLWEELKTKHQTIEFHHSYGLGVLLKDSDRCHPFIDQEKEWQIHYSLIAEDSKNKKTRKLLSNSESLLADCNVQIAGLTQTLAEHDSRILDLNQRIQNLLEQIAHGDAVVADRNQCISALYSSTTWRITTPMRYVSSKIKNLVSVIKLLPSIIRFGGGVASSINKLGCVFSREGWSGVRRRILFVGGNRNGFVSSMIRPDLNSGEVARSDYIEWVRRYDMLTDESRNAIRERIQNFRHMPLISVIMPVYNPQLEWLMEAIDSVRRQIYPHWELCIADDASTDKKIRSILERYSEEDKRIKVIFRAENGHISAASNSALEMAKGDWMALLDHDDLLAEHALFWVADAINRNPNVSLIYSDEDKIDKSGRRFDPYFKCDWNVDLFYSHNLISHLGVYRADLLKEIHGFREGLEGSQDYDLALRCIERIEPKHIYHIPKILYHWRAHDKSTAQAENAKPYAILAGERALNEHFQRERVNARAECNDHGYRVRHALPAQLPLVSLIIPTRNGLQLLQTCVQSILEKTTYPNYEILIVDNSSDDQAILQYFKVLQSNPLISVIHDNRPFNYSGLNNAAVKLVKGEIAGFLNNDLEVISPEWLSEMVSHALRKDVGAVGARLWYPDETIQHCGVVLGMGGVAGHAHKRLPRNHHGYFGRASLIQSFSAVTAACLVIRKSVFEEAGGFNEEDLQIAFNDIDFCLRLREKGYRNVWTPYAELYHHESATRGYEDSAEKQMRFVREVQWMKKRWGDMLLKDPAYSPNLTLDHDDFSLAWPPRI